MHIINIGGFVFGCAFSVFAAYYLLGLFSNAPWLQSDGRRKDGRWVVVPTPRSSRFTKFLGLAALALSNFDTAFYKDAHAREIIIIFVVMVVCVILFNWLSNLVEKRNRQTL